MSTATDTAQVRFLSVSEAGLRLVHEYGDGTSIEQVAPVEGRRDV